MLLFGPFMFLGYGSLALQAHLNSLTPSTILRHCSRAEQLQGGPWLECYLAIHKALYMSAFGDGIMRVCLPSLGADQFDHEDPSESWRQSSFFNWYRFGISLGGFIGLVLIVWLENYKGWDIGFGVCAVLILLGFLIVAAGLPLYRNQVLEGSPLTRILQVLVVAFRNRKLEFPNASSSGTGTGSADALSQARNRGFLDKACFINRGNNSGAWSVCSATKVEEAKTVLPVLHPLFISSIVG